MTAGARLRAVFDERGVDVDVTFPAGQVTALIGPNGAGKSTVLDALAGLLRPDRGTVEIAGAPVCGEGRFVPAHRRRVATLTQQASLFPHLDVITNVAFGPSVRGLGRAGSRQRAQEELTAVGALDLAERRPHSLSGGQAQRVALARALAIDPDVLLLDEPFSALDVEAAAQLRNLLGRRLAERETTAVIVTHDPLDVWTLARHVVALDGGTVAAQGPPSDVLDFPQNDFLAGLSEKNLVRGTANGDALAAAGFDVRGLWAAASEDGASALAVFPPGAVALFRDPPSGSPRNTWPVRVVTLASRGPVTRWRLELPDGQPISADLTPQGSAALAAQPEDSLVAQVKATQVNLYPRSD